jgi:hypothetical protein
LIDTHTCSNCGKLRRNVHYVTRYENWNRERTGKTICSGCEISLRILDGIYKEQ